MQPTRRPEICVGAIVVDHGCLLLIRRGTAPQAGRWSIPGGRVEWGEALPAAVERELYEETGVRANAGELVGWAERIDGEHHFVIFDFLAHVADAAAEPIPRAGDDAADARWVPLHDVDRWDLVAHLGEFLRAHGIIASSSESAGGA